MQTQHIHILGGGIMGLIAAYTLADGYHITLYDPQGFPAKNASFMAAGMLAPYSEIEHMDMAWVEAGLAAIDAWQEIHQTLNTDIGLSQNGSFLIAHRDDDYILQRFRTHLPANLQEYHTTQALEPNLCESYTKGLFLPQEAHLDPVKTMHALCQYLENHKNVTLTNHQPKTTTSTHITIDCRGMAANDSDIRGVKGEALVVRNREFTLTRPVRLMHPRYPLYILPRGAGVFMIGATQIESSDNDHVSLRSSMELMSALYALHPSFGEADIIDFKAGIRPSYPDNLPRITITGNRIACNGLFRHGYLLSPIIAQCVVAHLQGHAHPMMALFNNKDRHDKRNHQRAA